MGVCTDVSPVSPTVPGTEPFESLLSPVRWRVPQWGSGHAGVPGRLTGDPTEGRGSTCLAAFVRSALGGSGCVRGASLWAGAGVSARCRDRRLWESEEDARCLGE